MDLKASTVQGGVLVVHQLHDGKHQYEVGNVVKYKKTAGEKMFVRRGDKLLQINGMDLQLLTPEELAQMLAEGNPMLKVHKASRMKEPYEPPSPGEDTLHPVSKESMSLSFSMEMRREDEEGDGEGEGEGEEGEDGGLLEDVCKEETEVDGGNKDLLVVTMKKTSVSVVRGRACNPNSPCQGCNGVGCMYNDVVMVTESSTVTLVSRGSTFKKTKVEQVNVSVEHVASHQYLRSLCSQKSLYASPNPDGRVFLRVETCEKQRLKQISKDDKCTLSFVFYMKKARSSHTTFESVLHRGWFIQILNNTQSEVGMQNPDQQDEHSFLFIIQKTRVFVVAVLEGFVRLCFDCQIVRILHNRLL
ncbi:hypothetical protein INR49_004158 [Caranx melampygus]|nr:hypothetical protein INR49_004158 [Caranx melampygus]